MKKLKLTGRLKWGWEVAIINMLLLFCSSRKTTLGYQHMDNDVPYDFKLSRAEFIIGTKNFEVASVSYDYRIEFSLQGFREIVSC